MEIVDQPNLYDVNNVYPILTSILIFILQTVLTLLDTNSYVKEVGISNMGDSIISKAKFYLSYFSGYITYVLKTIVGLVGLWVLLTVIRCSFVIIFNLAQPLAEGAKLAEEFRGSMFYKLRVAMQSNAMYVLGMMFIDRFFAKFLIFGPLLILLAMVGISFFMYERKAMLTMLEEGELDKAQGILNTMHHHCMFFLMIVIIVIIVSVVRTYTNVFGVLNPTTIAAPA